MSQIAETKRQFAKVRAEAQKAVNKAMSLLAEAMGFEKIEFKILSCYIHIREKGENDVSRAASIAGKG